MCRIDEDMIGEQSHFLHAAQARKFTASCHVHVVMSQFSEDGTDLVQIDTNQYSSKLTLISTRRVSLTGGTDRQASL